MSGLPRVLQRLRQAEREARRLGIGPPDDQWDRYDAEFATTAELRELRDAIAAGEEVTPEHPTMRAIRERIEGGERPLPETRQLGGLAGLGKRPAPVTDASAGPKRAPDIGAGGEPEGEPAHVEAEPVEAAAESWRPDPEFGPPGGRGPRTSCSLRGRGRRWVIGTSRVGA